MRKPAFYLRMAAQGLRKNALFYLPFALTGSACAAMCYIMWYLRYNELIETMPGSMYVSTMLGLGSGVMVFLVVWILFYANTFVMKRRRRELGLYNILGMEKRHVAVLLGLESVLLYVVCTAAGIGAGALLSRLMLMVLLRLVRFEVPMGFGFCVRGAQQTAVAFAALFAVLYLKNLWQIRALSPIELLHSSAVGEREPKSRRLLAALGLLALAGGYGLSFFTTNPVLVILLFFVAVTLVIIGTHCLFGAGSVVVLKALRRNRRFYYKPRNFTAVSGMIYRMNQNARGLANICILATTVLVSVATTVCLYAGTDSLARNFPDKRDEYYNMYGSFMFLGIFLAILFMMATVLILYYKQISEGYEDRERFVILQKVGMSAAEVRGTIQSQVLMVFFLPLAVAALHMAAAFPMLLRMVGMFGITDAGLFLGCMAVTLAVFAVCYVVVYSITARKYYRIVRM